MELMMC